MEELSLFDKPLLDKPTETFYTKFNDVPVSTQTIISVSNLKFNLNTMYQYLPITDYVIVKKKGEEKRKLKL